MAGLIILAVLAWFALQFRESRAAIWRRRASFIEPLLVHICRDIRAVYLDVKKFAMREARQAEKLAKADEAFERFFNAG